MKNKNTGNQSRRIDTGGGAYVEGKVDTGGGDFVGRDQHNLNEAQAAVLARLFESILDRVEARPGLDPIDKGDLISDIQGVHAEAVKGEQVDETSLERLLRNIWRMAPDILEVVLAALMNPASGLVTAVRKVAERVREASQKPAG
jgi:hypothetical protein